MKAKFKRVPAVDKCVEILELLSSRKKPMGASEISKALHMNKSTVFNIVHTLDDLKILEKDKSDKFQFGVRLHILGKAAGRSSELISTVHPYLEEINQTTKLSAFLGIRSGLKAIIIDKVDSALDIKIHSEIGMQISLLAGAGGRALLSQLSDAEVDGILKDNALKPFTPNTIVNKKKYKQLVKKVRKDGITVDMEEYIEGIRAFGLPIHTNRNNIQIAIWAVGFKSHITNKLVPKLSDYLITVAKEIELRLT